LVIAASHTTMHGSMNIKLNLVKRSTCFGRSFGPSSGTQNCVYSNGICQTVAASCCYRGSPTCNHKLFLLLFLALQPTVGFSLLGDSLLFCSSFTLLSPPSYSHY